MALSAEERREAERERKREWCRANPDKVKAYRDRYEAKNRDRINERATRRARENPEKRNAWNATHKDYFRFKMITRKYGISREDWHAMWDRQGGQCAICKEPMTIGTGGACVDHCHTTGTVRDLLCHPCNTGIGFLKEDPTRLKAAAEYVAKHQERIVAHSLKAH